MTSRKTRTNAAPMYSPAIDDGSAAHASQKPSVV